MLVGVAFLPPSFPPSVNIGISTRTEQLVTKASLPLLDGKKDAEKTRR